MAKSKKHKNEMNEPAVEYGREIYFFNSFKEQEDYELKQMALLSPIEILQQLRQFINVAYGMHGYDAKKLPKKHTIKIIENK